jgi:membrane fusion protein (multidrug efflux system)
MWRRPRKHAAESFHEVDQMIKRLILMLVFLGVLFFLIFGFGAFRSYEIHKYFATLSNPPQTVATMPAVETPWQSSISAVGSVVAINGANISAEVAGIVDTIKFESGTDVAAGTVLATLRPNNDDAVLAQLQATAALDKITYDRDVQQLAADAISKAQVDTDRANLQSATAQVQAQQALMAEKVIKAPFAGRLGIRDSWIFICRSRRWRRFRLGRRLT